MNQERVEDQLTRSPKSPLIPLYRREDEGEGERRKPPPPPLPSPVEGEGDFRSLESLLTLLYKRRVKSPLPKGGQAGFKNSVQRIKRERI